jgi:hypothetical protein
MCILARVPLHDRFGNWRHMQYKVAYIHFDIQLSIKMQQSCRRSVKSLCKDAAHTLGDVWWTNIIQVECDWATFSVQTTHGRGGLQEHKKRTMWCVLKRLFTEPKTVEAFVKKIVIVIDGWHNKLSKDVFCLPVHTKNSVRNTDYWIDQRMR